MSGFYKGTAYYGNEHGWWIVGCLTAGEFTTLAALKQFIDDNTWLCPSNAGG